LARVALGAIGDIECSSGRLSSFAVQLFPLALVSPGQINHVRISMSGETGRIAWQAEDTGLGAYAILTVVKDGLCIGEDVEKAVKTIDKIVSYSRAMLIHGEKVEALEAIMSRGYATTRCDCGCDCEGRN
jgi:hypothetical protein